MRTLVSFAAVAMALAPTPAYAQLSSVSSRIRSEGSAWGRTSSGKKSLGGRDLMELSMSMSMPNSGGDGEPEETPKPTPFPTEAPPAEEDNDNIISAIQNNGATAAVLSTSTLIIGNAIFNILN